MTRADLVRLLREHRLAVVSTVGPEGAPQSAVVGCAISDGLEIVFDTLDDTRKARNLRRAPRVSLVIGWDREAGPSRLAGDHPRPGPAAVDSLERFYPEAAVRVRMGCRSVGLSARAKTREAG
jgi:pyridoxine/pyridoxamine 5'-phosphate oxidase